MGIPRIERKFAPVAPVQVLRGMLSHGVETFGSYHLLLAHHTVEQEEAFVDLFEDVQANGNAHNTTVIMDNSIVELGESQALPMMQKAVDIIRRGAPDINVIAVLPDVMGSGGPTQAAVSSAHDEWTDAFMGRAELMMVIQGNSIGDFLDTAKFALEYDNITWWGIPRILYETCGSRAAALVRLRDQLIGSEMPYREWPKMHLLGFCDNMEDDYLSATFTGLPIMGIDSAVPLRMEEPFRLNAQVGPRPANWFEEATFNHDMLANLQAARGAFNQVI